jgi:hypothetical protein
VLDPADALEHSAVKVAYERGEINAEEYALKIKELLKPKKSRHVGMIKEDVHEAIGLFAGDPEERERMLRAQVEGMTSEPDEWDQNGILEKDGRPRRLAVDDPRAIEFRERLRTW